MHTGFVQRGLPRSSPKNALYKKKKWIIKHIKETYLANLDLFMMRFDGYDDALNLRLRLPFLYEDGTPMMATLAPHKLVYDFGACMHRPVPRRSI